MKPYNMFRFLLVDISSTHLFDNFIDDNFIDNFILSQTLS